MQPKFVAAQKMLLKQKPSKTIRKWIARFYYFRAFILRWKRVCIAHNKMHELPIGMGGSSALLINILLGSFQLFA